MLNSRRIPALAIAAVGDKVHLSDIGGCSPECNGGVHCSTRIPELPRSFDITLVTCKRCLRSEFGKWQMHEQYRRRMCFLRDKEGMSQAAAMDQSAAEQAAKFAANGITFPARF